MELHLGELARILDVPPRRVDGWLRRGFLRATKPRPGPGRGRYKVIPETELAIARRALRVMRRYGVPATRTLFDVVRAEVTNA